MPRKKKEQVTQEVKVTEPKFGYGKCHHCGREADEFKSAKGDRNQFQFCSIECWNKDTTEI